MAEKKDKDDKAPEKVKKAKKVEKPKKAKPQEVYLIHSAVRSVETRIQRALSPTRHRFTMLLGGGLVRVVRKRPASVTRKMLNQLLPELMEKERLGMLVVKTPSGQRVDLNTMKVTSVVEKVSPKPNPPQDSIKNDKNEGVGIPMPPLEGGHPETSTPAAPAVTNPDIIPEGVEEGAVPALVEEKQTSEE